MCKSPFQRKGNEMLHITCVSLAACIFISLNGAQSSKAVPHSASATITAQIDGCNKKLEKMHNTWNTLEELDNAHATQQCKRQLQIHALHKHYNELTQQYTQLISPHYVQDSAQQQHEECTILALSAAMTTIKNSMAHEASNIYNAQLYYLQKKHHLLLQCHTSLSKITRIYYDVNEYFRTSPNQHLPTTAQNIPLTSPHISCNPHVFTMQSTAEEKVDDK